MKELLDRDITVRDEYVLYECVVHDDDIMDGIKIVITNKRLIWIIEGALSSILLKNINRYSIYEDSDYYDGDEYGKGEYGIYIEYNNNDISFWLECRHVWKEFYHQLTTALISQ